MAALAFEVTVFGLILFWVLALLPAAIVTLLKGRYLYFGAGWLTLGIVWFVGAVALADPGSAWARRFYGPRQLARAADPERHPRPRRIVVAWLAASAGAVLLLGLFAARPAPVVGIDGKALGRSVSGYLEDRPCRQVGSRTWICARHDAQFSGAVSYRVTVDRLGCWTGVLEGYRGEGNTKPRLDGCVRLYNVAFS